MRSRLSVTTTISDAPPRVGDRLRGRFDVARRQVPEFSSGSSHSLTAIGDRASLADFFRLWSASSLLQSRASMGHPDESTGADVECRASNDLVGVRGVVDREPVGAAATSAYVPFGEPTSRAAAISGQLTRRRQEPESTGRAASCVAGLGSIVSLRAGRAHRLRPLSDPKETRHDQQHDGYANKIEELHGFIPGYGVNDPTTGCSALNRPC